MQQGLQDDLCPPGSLVRLKLPTGADEVHHGTGFPGGQSVQFLEDPGLHFFRRLVGERDGKYAPVQLRIVDHQVDEVTRQCIGLPRTR